VDAPFGENIFERDCRSLQDRLPGMPVQHVGVVPDARADRAQQEQECALRIVVTSL